MLLVISYVVSFADDDDDEEEEDTLKMLHVKR
jgi:hypothetical protein